MSEVELTLRRNGLHMAWAAAHGHSFTPSYFIIIEEVGSTGR
jgi:hypothetical protein